MLTICPYKFKPRAPAHRLQCIRGGTSRSIYKGYRPWITGPSPRGCAGPAPPAHHRGGPRAAAAAGPTGTRHLIPHRTRPRQAREPAWTRCIAHLHLAAGLRLSLSLSHPASIQFTSVVRSSSLSCPLSLPSPLPLPPPLARSRTEISCPVLPAWFRAGRRFLLPPIDPGAPDSEIRRSLGRRAGCLIG